MGARTIWIARHGETDWNRDGRWQGMTDVPLSEVGLAQAAALAERLRGMFDAAAREAAALAPGVEPVQVHSSDLLRARQTAEVVAATLGVAPPRLHVGLRERGFGCFEGLTRAECELRFPDAWRSYLADRRSTPPGAEPHMAVIARVRAVMLDIARATAEGAAALVISHGGTIRTFVQTVTGEAPPPVGNAALFRARFDGARFMSVEPVGEIRAPPTQPGG